MDRITAQDLADVPALTLLNPWPVAVLYLGKGEENRVWPPPAKLRRVLVHAGKRWDRAGSADLRLRGFAAALDRVVTSAIVGLAEVTGVCRAAVEGGRCRCSTWAMPGQYHWQLANVIALPEPVPCAGSQRLWRPSVEVVEAVVASLALYADAPLVCTGRRWDPRTARAVSSRCGLELKPEPEETQTAFELRARVAGWRLGPANREPRHVMCPGCGRAE